MPRTESPAAKLLLWCVRAFVARDTAGSAPTSSLGDADWAEFIRHAHRHSCLPLAWRALQDEANVPQAVLGDLRTAFHANAVHNLRLSGELIAATRYLAAAGVTAASWKGPLLAQRAYGDLRLRQFFDLDVLVRRQDLPRAVEALADLGFRSEHSITSRQQTAYVDHMGELELVRDVDGLRLELHTAIVPTYFGRGRNSDELWEHLTSGRLARAEVPALDRVDELEALCVHGSKHRWERLEWIVDVAMLGQMLNDDEWKRLFAGARRRGTRRMVDTALLLAVGVCGATFASSAVRTARADSAAGRLAAIARRALFDPRPGRTDELRFHVQMWDSAPDSIRYLASIPVTPSVADWEFVNLPPILTPLYVVVRPLRFVRELLRARRAPVD